MRNRKNIPTVFDDETGEQIPIAYVNEVCGRCDGEGTHTNPNIGAITATEWAEDWGDDERAGYLDGRYDVACEECGGLRVVAVADPSGPYFEQWEAEQYERAGWDAVDRMERAYGC